MITFKHYLNEGQIEHDHIKRVMDTIHPSKRASARKAYMHAKKTMPHAAALNAMRLYAEDVENFDTLIESVLSENWVNSIDKVQVHHHGPSGFGCTIRDTKGKPLHTHHFDTHDEAVKKAKEYHEATNKNASYEDHTE